MGRRSRLGWWEKKWQSWVRSKVWVFERSLLQSISCSKFFPLPGGKKKQSVFLPQTSAESLSPPPTLFTPLPSVKSFLLSSCSRSFRTQLHYHFLWDTPWWIHPSPPSSSCSPPCGLWSAPWHLPQICLLPQPVSCGFTHARFLPQNKHRRLPEGKDHIFPHFWAQGSERN